MTVHSFLSFAHFGIGHHFSTISIQFQRGRRGGGGGRGIVQGLSYCQNDTSMFSSNWLRVSKCRWQVPVCLFYLLEFLLSSCSKNQIQIESRHTSAFTGPSQFVAASGVYQYKSRGKIHSHDWHRRDKWREITKSKQEISVGHLQTTLTIFLWKYGDWTEIL